MALDPKIVGSIKKALQDAVDEAKRGRMDDERKRLMSTMGQDVAAMILPALAKIIETSQVNKENLREMVHAVMAEFSSRQVAIDTKPITDAIESAMLGVQMPAPKVTVTSPQVNIPPMVLPEEMKMRGWVELMTGGGKVGYNNPLPVTLFDVKGNPLKLFENLTQVLSGGGGGKADFFTIKGFSASAFSELQNADGRIKVSVETGGSGLTDAELRASSVPVEQVSGSMWSTAVKEIFGSTASSDVFNGDNRIRVSVETGSSGLTDAELRAMAVPVSQVSGANWSVSFSDVFATSATSTVVNPDNRVRVELPATTITAVTDITNSVKAALIDSSGVQYSGSNPVPITGTVVASDITASVKAALIDSSGVQYSGSNPVPVNLVSQSLASSASALVDSGGVQYSGSNPVPVTMVSNSATSTIATGPTAVDAADDGSAPVQMGGIARTANPTAVAAGDVVKQTMDDLGRAIVRPVQVRDLTLTAYVSVTNGTETTLRAAVAGAFLDCIMLVGSNNSDAAVSVDVRAVTGGNIVHTLRIPANGTAGWAPTVPWPQDATGNNWTVDGPDETGRTLTFSALFSQEV